MYTVLTGAPPFMASPLSEMYQNIREGHYPEPAHVSSNARRLIARLLAPDPAERPSLEHLLQDDFFTQGFTPDRLPAHSCHSPPIFAVPPPLGRIFRKVGQLLLTQRRPPCPFTPKEASGPGKDGPDPDPMERGGESSLSAKAVPCLEAPVHLVAHGTLQSDLAGPEGSRRPEVEAALRHLQLCLDMGLPATQDPLGEQRPILWAPKWVDHSSKYGFGYQLSDGGSAGRHPHGPASPRRPSVLHARPREAGTLHPEGCARPAVRQAGRAAALCRLPAAAAAGGGDPLHTCATCWTWPLPPALPGLR
uniref:Protein kinase domain-containing protein n=1 Tax=Colobus angolensis palliatus TaxID=336983 RepID=A0A2K5HUS0_COLAP